MAPHSLTRPTFNLIGCGRVGLTLTRLLSDQVTVQGLYAPREASRQAALDFIGSGTPCTGLAEMPSADLWLLAVPDSHIAPVATQLAEQLTKRVPSQVGAKPPVVFHCSGFLSSAVLSPLAERGWTTASLHPVLSFASPALAIQQFAGTPCALEGSPAALAVLRPLFEHLGARCFGILAEQKALYHAAAVFSNNFTVVLQGMAQAAWQNAGVPSEWLTPLTEALLNSATTNVLALGPQAALTGPAARGDQAVLQQQAQVVQQWDPLSGQAYQVMSELAQRLKSAPRPSTGSK
jgi:predicted short-subunit dehydrogenase-like oxidoreductase (DUF2520 family)